MWRHMDFGCQLGPRKTTEILRLADCRTFRMQTDFRPASSPAFRQWPVTQKWTLSEMYVLERPDVRKYDDMHRVWRTNCERWCDSTWARPAPSCSASVAYTCLNECGKRRQNVPTACCIMLRHQMQALPEDADRQQKHTGRAMWMNAALLTWRVWLRQLTSPFFWDVDPRQVLKCPYLGHWTQRPRL
jgi:hypothetical protein